MISVSLVKLEMMRWWGNGHRLARRWSSDFTFSRCCPPSYRPSLCRCSIHLCLICIAPVCRAWPGASLPDSSALGDGCRLSHDFNRQCCLESGAPTSTPVVVGGPAVPSWFHRPSSRRPSSRTSSSSTSTPINSLINWNRWNVAQ